MTEPDEAEATSRALDEIEDALDAEDASRALDAIAAGEPTVPWEDVKARLDLDDKSGS